MKYYVSIKESYYNKSKRELFYQSLMKKRIGKDNYVLHKYNNQLSVDVSDLLKSSENLFSNYIIEFADKASFTKFKISYKNLLNPSLSNPSQRITNCKSFMVEDDFENNIINLLTEYKSLDHRRRTINSIIENLYRCKLLTNSSSAELSKIDLTEEKISKDFIETYSNEDIVSIEKLITQLQDVFDKNLFDISQTTYVYTHTPLDHISKNNHNYYYIEHMNKLKEEAKKLFIDVIDLEIPVTNKVAN